MNEERNEWKSDIEPWKPMFTVLCFPLEEKVLMEANLDKSNISDLD